ncbi:MAG: hypothetical protein F4W92_01605 [Gammaproteobacteria bacterium]|nr:hypothetical protein [Gammaproteobacteria bacterium]
MRPEAETIFQQMYYLMLDGQNLLIACVVLLVILGILGLIIAITLGVLGSRLRLIDESQEKGNMINQKIIDRLNTLIEQGRHDSGT